MILTNIRIVWFATTNAMYNVSIPYLQAQACRIRNSRFGLALVIETSVVSGEYVLGFRVDPEDRLQNVCKTIRVLQKAFATKPVFGVQHSRERPGTPQAVGEEVKQVDEDVELDERPLRSDAYAAYFSDGLMSEEVRPPVYSEELGVAIEQLKPGFTISDLWQIHGTPQAVGEEVKQVDEDVELDERPLRSDAYAAYFSDGLMSEEVRPPVYSEELGVAIEQLKPGFTISDLWQIHVE
ncbi:unnamed protein product [Gongylonema pulchrum]|uniref:Ku domain-containing protein n=1 Tax=Gongylonema pulchrum TaxID=637853 RepID=A0A183E6R8_9BILA|nr:unnamed protein product [Gongylonema pulchrum]